MPFVFENLQVSQKAVDLAFRIAATTETFPRGNYLLTDQLNRAQYCPLPGILNRETNSLQLNRTFCRNSLSIIKKNLDARPGIVKIVIPCSLILQAHGNRSAFHTAILIYGKG